MSNSHLFGRVLESVDAGSGSRQNFNLWNELGALRKSESWKRGSSRRTLVQYPDFRIDLVAMKRGMRMPQHANAGRISVQCISGLVRMHTESGPYDLPSGEVLVLDYGVWHDVEAVYDSAFLLTVALPNADVPALFNSGRWVLPSVYSRVEEDAVPTH